jgi:hypothetical protein
VIAGESPVAPPTRQAAWLIAACCVLVLVSFAVPGKGFWVVDCGARYLQLVNIVDRHHFGSFSIDYPIRDLDPGFRLLPMSPIQAFVREGKLYSQYPPWFAYLVAPVYAVAGPAAMRLAPLLSGMFLLFGCWKLAFSAGLRRPHVAALVCLFGTPLLPYCFTFWDIIPATACAVWSLWFAVEALNRGCRRRALWSGVLCAVAFLLREEFLIWGACQFGALLLERGKRHIAIIGGCVFAAGCAALMTANYRFAGTPLFFFTGTGSGVNETVTWRFGTRPTVAYLYLAYVTGGKLADFLLFAGVCGLAFLPATRNAAGRLAITAVALACTLAIRFWLWDVAKPLVTQYNVNSMASAAPIVFAGLRLWRRDRNGDGASAVRAVLARTALGFIGATLVLSVPWSAVGFHWGPRLLLPAYPVLAVVAFAGLAPAFSGMHFSSRRLVAAFVVLMIAIGFVDSAYYVVRLRTKVRMSSELLSFLRKTEPGVPILTNVQWLATDVPELFCERPIIDLSNPGRQGEAFDAARAIHETGAVLVTSGPPPEIAVRKGVLTSLPIEKEVGFPDNLFRIRAFLLSYR